MSRVGPILGLFVICFQIGYSAETLERTYLRLTVTSSDSEGDRLAAGLTRNDFQILDRGAPQFIEYFSAAPSPSSVTVLLDMDGSMRSIDLDHSLKILVKISNLQSVPDEVSLIGFAEKPAVIKSFDWQVKNINFSNILELVERKSRFGQAGLANTLFLAADRLRTQARNYNQAIVLITDAEEDLSLSTTQQIRNQIERMGVRVYGVFFPGKRRLDHGRLHDLVIRSGGRYFRISEPAPLELILRWMLHELRYQYIIGFTPSAVQTSHETNRISVRLSNARPIPASSIRYTSTKTIGRIQRKESNDQ